MGIDELEIYIRKLHLHYLPRKSTSLKRLPFGKCVQGENDSV